MLIPSPVNAISQVWLGNMSKLQDEIHHLTGVLAGLSSDNPAWTTVQNQIAALRAKVWEDVDASAEAADALPKKPLIPVDVKTQMDADLAALEKMAGGGGA